MSKGMIKIDTIVREALADKGYDTPHLYAKYLMWALRCLREMNIDHTEDVKTVQLPISAIKTVAYPEDYITYNKIGTKFGDRFIAFVRDGTITNHHVDRYSPNPTFYDEAQTLSFYNFNNVNPNLTGERASFYGTYDRYGYAHNGFGYFKPNDECKEFQLSSEITSKSILLEYVYNNFNPDTETFVTIMMQEVIRQYVHYQEATFKQGGSIGAKREAEMDFLYALSDYDKRISDISYQGILNSIRINTTLRVKG